MATSLEEKKNIVHIDLDEEQKSVMRALVEFGRAVSAGTLAEKLGLHPVKIEVHIEHLWRTHDLVEMDMVMTSDIYGGDSKPKYVLTARGKQYAVLHQMLK